MPTSNGQRPVLQRGDYLSPQEVAEILPGMTLNSLAVRRHRHQEPTFCRLGRTILYPRDVILRWLDEGTVEATPHAR